MRISDRGRLLAGIVSTVVIMVAGCGNSTSSVAPPPGPSSLAAASGAAAATTITTICPTAVHQPIGTIVTIAGTGEAGFAGDGGAASEARLNQPMDVVVDAGGVVFVGDASHRVRRIGPDGVITTFAGTGEPGFFGDGGPAVDARLDMPSGLALGLDGSLLIVDKAERRIRRIDPSGRISTVVGSGVFGSDGDGGPALDATIQPLHLAIGTDGTLYFDDANRFRSVTDGVIHAYAGTGTAGFSGDGGAAVHSTFGEVQGAAADDRGNVFLVDTGNLRARKVDAAGMVSTVAGSGAGSATGDGGPAALAGFARPVDVAIGGGGAIYISDYSGDVVRRVGRDGIISTIAGGPRAPALGDCGPAPAARLDGPTGLAVRDGMLYVVEQDGHRIRRIALGD